jgi:hypothetical protein
MKTGLYDKEGKELSLEQACSMLPLGKVSRVEVINHVDPQDGHARAYVKYADMNVSLSPQDEGRTLKIFLSK